MNLTTIGTGILAFMILDGIWLGFVMKKFYVNQLAPVGRIVDGGFVPVWWAAALVYVFLGLGIAAFVVPRADSVGSAALFGALFGLVTYGVYDMTNYSTLSQWPLGLAIADIAWGACAAAIVAAAAFSIGAR
jgi:uncharacterized membrane protein